jgi:hypothetical protein
MPSPEIYIIILRLREILKDGPKDMSEILDLLKRRFGRTESSHIVEKTIKEHLSNEIDQNIQTGKYYFKLKEDNNTSGYGLHPKFQEYIELMLTKNRYIQKYTPQERQSGNVRDLLFDNEQKIRACLKDCIELLHNVGEKKRREIISDLPTEAKTRLITEINKNNITFTNESETIKAEETKISSDTLGSEETINTEQDEQHQLSPESLEIGDINYNVDVVTFESLVPENRELRDSLIFPIIFKDFPNISALKINPDKFSPTLYTYWISNISENTETLDEILFAVNSNVYVTDEEAFLYWLIFLIKQSAQLLERADEIYVLEKYLQNPYYYFFDIIDRKIENVSFAYENPEFYKVLKETCRDNKVTQAEREFLFRKAKDYFIDEQLLEQYLNNPFIGYESFKIIVDQVCSDTELSTEEENYLRKKAQQYHVPDKVLDEMVGMAIVRASLINKLSGISGFYEIVLIYLVAHTFKVESVNRIILQYFNKSSFFRKIAHNFPEIATTLFEELITRLSDKLKGQNSIENIWVLFEKLNVHPLLLKDAKEVFTTTSDEKNYSQNQLNSGWEIQFEGNTGKNVDINFIDKRITFRNTTELSGEDVLKLFLENISQRRKDFRSPEIDLFFENLQDFFSYNF